MVAMYLALGIFIITLIAHRLNTVDDERIKNQERIERAWEFFRNVFENLEEAVMVLDCNGNALYSNTSMKNLELDIRKLWEENLRARDLPQPINTFKSAGGT